MEDFGILTCRCGGALDMTKSNGVTDPAEGSRIEYFECASCGDTGTLILHPDNRETHTGCLA